MRQLSDLDFVDVSRILNLPDGVDPQEPATVAQLNSAIEGNKWKVSARVAAPGNTNLAAPGASVDGVAMVSGDRVLISNQTDQTENGIYAWTGAATPMVRTDDANTFAELEGAVISVEEGTSAGVTYRQTQVNGVIGVDDVIWTTFGTSAPPASETVAGIAEIATQGETDAGTDDERIVTPEKLANWSGRVYRYGPTQFGDGTETDYVITHNLNTRDVFVTVRLAATPYEEVGIGWEATSVNTITIKASAPVGVNELTVSVLA